VLEGNTIILPYLARGKVV